MSYCKKLLCNNQAIVGNFVLNTFKYIILLLFPILAYTQEYNSYTMFNNFEVVAPDTPAVKVNNKIIKMYSSKEEDKDIAVIIQNLPTGLEFDIGEYTQTMKKMMDDSITEGENIGNYEVTHFSSIFNRKKNIYVATYFAAPKKVDEGAYMAKKVIIKGKERYTWIVTSYNKKDTENTFNKYKDRIK